MNTDLYTQDETETPVEVIQSLQEPAKPAAPDQTALAVRESISKVQGALPTLLALQVEQAILAAEPPKQEAAPQKRKGKA